MSAVRIDIWSDIACPWCWVGKRRLEKALEAAGLEGDIHWHSFELDPGAAREQEAGKMAERLAKKYGMPVAMANQRIQHLTDLAAKDGLEMRFDRVHPTNTFDAHRIVHLGKAKGRQHAVKERLLRAYMTEGEHLGDADTLVKLAEEAGLDADEARAVLASDQFSNEVRGDEAEARQLGVNGVPFFVFDQKYAVEGAQPVEVFSQVLDRVKVLSGAEKAPVCGPDGCEI